MKNTEPVKGTISLNNKDTLFSIQAKSTNNASCNYYSFLSEYFSDDDSYYSKLLGRFYTHEFIYTEIVRNVIDNLNPIGAELHVIDPFCGDGRLVAHFIEQFLKTDKANGIKSLFVSLWDVDSTAVMSAKEKISIISEQNSDLSIVVYTSVRDAFISVSQHRGEYDVCITNPPWCILKPEKEYRCRLSIEAIQMTFENVMEKYSDLLRESYTYSMPKRKFGRWGLNLSRIGAESAMQLLSVNGVCGIVLPASFFSDQISEALRKWMFEEHSVKAVSYYPAELKLFGSVDQSSATVVLTNSGDATLEFSATVYDRKRKRMDAVLDGASLRFMRSSQYVLPFGYDERLFDIANQLKKLKPLSDYRNLKIGRELDETRIDSRLSDSGSLQFIKGFMVGRYSCLSEPVRYLRAVEANTAPESTKYERIAWRDVSRSSQKRRMHATIIPAGTVTGNSLGVVHIPDASHAELAYILAVINSMVFEFQARRHLVTNHVPSGVLKKITIPPTHSEYIKRIALLVDKTLSSSGSSDTTNELECLVAKAYGLTIEDFLHVVGIYTLSDEDLKNLEATAYRIFSEEIVW